MDAFYFSTKGLTVGYRGVPLIRDISIRLKKGEILTLIGPNGVGKTTILKNLIRQMEPIGGAVYLNGQDVRAISRGELSKKLSVVLTERVRPERMTCADVVATGRYPYTGKFGVLSQADWKVVRECMELVRVADLEHRDFLQTSDGQKQRVMLARALCQEPELIVLDEPTSFLDVRYKLEFLSILQKLTRTKKLSAILSLHEIDLASKISDQVLCVHGDHVERYGPPEEVFSGGYISTLYEMTAGSYDEATGSLELEPATGPPAVFVLCGNGSGSPLFRRLQRAGVPFAAGVLWENDLDYPVARMLAGQVVSAPAFSALLPEQLAAARALVDQCRQTVCTLPDSGLTGLALPLRELRDYAAAQGKLIASQQAILPE